MLDPDAVDELEALLISSDLGVGTVQNLIESVRVRLEGGAAISQDQLSSILKDDIEALLINGSPQSPEIVVEPRPDGPTVILVVGVNGAGKTTSTAKLAARFVEQNKKVLMVAADTFRAAAVAQLKEWGERLDVPVVAGEENAKPAAVVYDAMERALSESFDVVLVDTAGRLHTKSNLMQELSGVRNVIQRHQASAPHETLLVVDGSTGQNALQQAREFNEATELSGVIVTKLDGTPKGGIVVAIKRELGIPVRYIGVGESARDLRPFDASSFVSALFDTEGLSELEEESAHAQTRRRRRRRASL